MESESFSVIKDLMVNRSAFDRVIQAGGYVSTTTGGVEDANSLQSSRFLTRLWMPLNVLVVEPVLRHGNASGMLLFRQRCLT